MKIQELNKELGNIDIYLLDQILKERYSKANKILDAGCGEGRNLVYFLNNGFDVYGIDKNEKAIEMLQFVARSKKVNVTDNTFQVVGLENIPFESNTFDHVICNAVLHFAESEAHFEQMLCELIRVLQPEGSMFIRMTSNIGIENEVEAIGEGKYNIPDGSIRFLLTKELLDGMMKKYQLSFLEPLKTVNVNDKRCMTTLVLKYK